VVDVYRGDVEAQPSYWKLLLYASLFHQCIAGPIVRYADVCREIDNRSPSRQEISRGVTRFAVGFAKKAIFANYCALLADTLLPYSQETLAAQSVCGLLLGALCYTFHIYLDFSAYSDMAIGMGLMVGFHYRENFYYPYMAVSVTDFWRRWHISLSSFFRDYVYIPLGGNRCSVPRQILNLTAVWLLTGLWHGADWNFVLWGLYYLLFLLLEKFVFKWGKKDRIHGLGELLRRSYVLVVVLVGWMLFRFDDLPQLGTVLSGFVGANGNPFLDLTVRLEFRNNLFFLVAAAVACTPVVPYLSRKLDAIARRPGHAVLARVYPVACSLLPALLILLSMLALVGDSYNPFLYFRF
jgi:alginate O-acetyltransferase complex protein AlgI